MSTPSNISVVVTAVPDALTVEGSGIQSRLTIAGGPRHVGASAHWANGGAKLDAETVSIQTCGGDLVAAAMFWRSLANAAADMADKMMFSLVSEGGDAA